MDFARSDDPAVQAQLDRLGALAVPQGRFGLETITALLARLGDPHRRLPPTFHVAGTNGKGSTCAFLRAVLEAQGLAVHVATSPHLVRYNERIRIAGTLIEDALLASLLAEVIDIGLDLDPSFFEVTAAATFLAFARIPADACVIEVGLGGRLDATNVLEAPAACGVATLGIDHEMFLLRPEEGTPEDPLARIAFEKASIAKPGAPLVTQAYPLRAAGAVERTAAAHGAALFMRGRAWRAEADEGGIAYQDGFGPLALPLPAMPGAHQADNAALAAAMLRHQDRVRVSPEAMAQGIRSAHWPARMQRLGAGPLTRLAPGHAVWLDGGHNPDAGGALARFFGADAGAPTDPARPEPAQGIHLILGMLANKDPAALTAPLADRIASLQVVPVPGHEHHAAGAFGPSASPAADVEQALAGLPGDGLPILIAGSLYLAGDVLRLNGELPD